MCQYTFSMAGTLVRRNATIELNSTILISAPISQTQDIRRHTLFKVRNHAENLRKKFIGTF